MRLETEIRSFFDARGRSLTDPSCLPVLPDAVPFPVYTPQSLSVITDPSANARRVRAVARAFLDLGVTQVRPDILCFSAPSGGRMVVDLRLAHLRDGRPTGAVSDLTYYLRVRGCCMSTAMLEIVRCPAYALAEQRGFPRPF